MDSESGNYKFKFRTGSPRAAMCTDQNYADSTVCMRGLPVDKIYRERQNSEETQLIRLRSGVLRKSLVLLFDFLFLLLLYRRTDIEQ